VRARIVKIVQVITQVSAQVIFTDDDQMIEIFSANRVDDAFGVWILEETCDLKKKMASGGSKRWRALYPESTTYEMLPRPGWKH